MVITDLTKKTSAVVCALSLFYCSQGMAQGANFQGGIRVGALQTDNVFLRPAQDEIKETIYQVSPSLGFDYENQRIDASVRYQFDWYDYSDLDTSNEYHRYDALFTGVLIQDALFLDIGGSRTQSVIDPDAVIPVDGLPITNNLADRDEYFVNPRIEKALGRSVTLRADYRHSVIQFDQSDFAETQFIQDNTNDSASFQLENYRKEQGLTWAVNYEWRETEYDQSLPWEYRRASGELGFFANSKMRIFGSGGKESAWDDPVDRSLQDDFWEVGFAYNNGEKAYAEFAAGERSFGSSWRGQLDVALRRGNLTFSYAETPTTPGFDRYTGGNLFNPDVPNDYLTRPGSAERYISERGQASLSFEFRRTSLGIGAYHENRTGRFLADGTPLADESQRGASISFTWQVGARTGLTASGAVNTREPEFGVKEDFITGAIAVSYQLGSSVGLSLGYNYTEQDPETGSSGDYIANVVSLYLNYSF